MEIKKIGYVTTVLTIAIGVVLFLIMNNTIKIDTSGSLLGSTAFIMFLVPAVLIFFAFWLLTNMEHHVIAIIDIVLGVLYAGMIILFIVMPKEDAESISKFLIYGSEAAGVLALLNIPFLVRTQSKLHRYFKYLLVLLLGVTSFFGISVVNTYLDIIESGEISFFTNVSEKAQKKLADIQNKSEIAVYVGFASFLGIICNPMLGYASGDGLGGGGSSSNTPKLVPRNTATDPNMNTGINPNEGINYGDMPIPEGVVANNPTAMPPVGSTILEAPGITPVEQNVVINPVPAAQPVPNANSVVEALNVPNPVPAPAPAVAPVPDQNINMNGVSPENPNVVNNNNSN